MSTFAVLGQFPGYVVSYFYLDLNGKRRQEKHGGRGVSILDWMYTGGGGAFRCVLCATGGRWAVLKSGKSAYVINGRPHRTNTGQRFILIK